MPIPILFQNDDFVAVHKPSGLLVHRSSLAREASEFALQIVRDQMGRKVYPVHRLDRGTSGLLLFALTPQSAARLANCFAEGRVHKTYLAVVRGIAPVRTLIDYPLREELDAIADRQARKDKPAQEARTEIERVAAFELPVRVDKFPTSRYSLVQASPQTGRKHQIRRHLRHLGHPIIGDVTHGVGKHNRYFAENFGNRRMLLACTQMKWTDPRSGEQLEIRAPLDEAFGTVLHQLERHAYAPT